MPSLNSTMTSLAATNTGEGRRDADVITLQAMPPAAVAFDPMWAPRPPALEAGERRIPPALDGRDIRFRRARQQAVVEPADRLP
jgi:hypothetical protein